MLTNFKRGDCRGSVSFENSLANPGRMWTQLISAQGEPPRNWRKDARPTNAQIDTVQYRITCDPTFQRMQEERDAKAKNRRRVKQIEPFDWEQLPGAHYRSRKPTVREGWTQRSGTNTSSTQSTPASTNRTGRHEHVPVIHTSRAEAICWCGHVCKHPPSPGARSRDSIKSSEEMWKLRFTTSGIRSKLQEDWPMCVN
jgi:hypothetical protein